MVLAVVVFLFVIEPILRAKSDETILDAVALPQTIDPRDIDDEVLDLHDDTASDDAGEPTHDPPAIAARRVSNDVA